jgi:hypothetical protein
MAVFFLLSLGSLEVNMEGHVDIHAGTAAVSSHDTSSVH